LLLSVAIVLLPALPYPRRRLHRWDGATTPVFVGLKNFRRRVLGPHLLGRRFRQRAVDGDFLTIPMAIAMIAAAILMNRKKSSAIFQIIFLLPYVLSSANRGYLAEHRLRSCLGPAWVHLPQLVPIQDPLDGYAHGRSMPSPASISALLGLPHGRVLRGHAADAEDQLEAAFIPKARTAGKVFRNVHAAQHPAHRGADVRAGGRSSRSLTFDYIYLIPQGGPARSTEMLSTFAYAFAFTSFQVARAANGCAGDELLRLVAPIVYVRLSRAELENDRYSGQKPPSMARARARSISFVAVLVSLVPLMLVALNTFKPHAAIVANPLSLPTASISAILPGPGAAATSQRASSIRCCFRARR